MVVGDSTTLLPVALGGLKLLDVLGCQRLIIEGGLLESARHGVRSFPAEVLDKPQRSMDLWLR